LKEECVKLKCEEAYPQKRYKEINRKLKSKSAKIKTGAKSNYDDNKTAAG